MTIKDVVGIVVVQRNVRDAWSEVRPIRSLVKATVVQESVSGPDGEGEARPILKNARNIPAAHELSEGTMPVAQPASAGAQRQFVNHASRNAVTNVEIGAGALRSTIAGIGESTVVSIRAEEAGIVVKRLPETIGGPVRQAMRCAAAERCDDCVVVGVRSEGALDPIILLKREKAEIRRLSAEQQRIHGGYGRLVDVTVHAELTAL